VFFSSNPLRHLEDLLESLNPSPRFQTHLVEPSLADDDVGHGARADCCHGSRQRRSNVARRARVSSPTLHPHIHQEDSAARPCCQTHTRSLQLAPSSFVRAHAGAQAVGTAAVRAQHNLCIIRLERPDSATYLLALFRLQLCVLYTA
jgi:hypothetical protein